MGWLPGVQELEETSKCLEIMTPLIVNVTRRTREIRGRGRRLDYCRVCPASAHPQHMLRNFPLI
jgi:hypothetical protein